jgi:signal transduction histidine kinase
MQEHLHATITHLRALIAELHFAREEERTRTARAIHDELGSALTGLRWGLEELEKAITEPETTPSPERVRKRLHDLFGLSDTAIETVRRISSELRPRLLDDLGLAAAIEWQAQQFQTRTGILCRCDHALEDVHLTRDQSTAIFRIFQEALTNVLRHPQVGIISVIMEQDTREFKLRISDNGSTEDEKSGQLLLGLLGMRERAQLVDGTVDISRSSATGTTVIVRIPTPRRTAD